MSNTLPLSAEFLTDERILLIENGTQLMVWATARVDNQLPQQMTDDCKTSSDPAETASSFELMKQVGKPAKQVDKFIQRVVSERKGLSRPQVVERNKAGAQGEPQWIMPLLIEDRGSGGTHSYVE